MSADPDLRASDAERRRVAESLRRHYLDGRLTQDDFDERVGRRSLPGRRESSRSSRATSAGAGAAPPAPRDGGRSAST